MKTSSTVSLLVEVKEVPSSPSIINLIQIIWFLTIREGVLERRFICWFSHNHRSLVLNFLNDRVSVVIISIINRVFRYWLFLFFLFMASSLCIMALMGSAKSITSRLDNILFIGIQGAMQWPVVWRCQPLNYSKEGRKNVSK